jgi:hypothetical protein
MTTEEIQNLINNIGVDRVEMDADKMILMLNNGDEVRLTLVWVSGDFRPTMEFEYINKSLAI